MKKKPNIKSAPIEEVEQTDYAILSLGELQYIIGDMEQKEPKDKRKTEYRAYITELNKLFSVYNAKAGQKIYKLIKL